MTRWGMTLPLSGAPLEQLSSLASELAAEGYTDFWSSEVDAWDGVTPLVAVAAAEPTVTVGTAILPVHTRGPAVLAQTAATLSALSGGRFVLGIGSSAPAVVRDWNAVPHDAPLQRVSDTLEFLREALNGAKVDRAWDTFAVRGFQLKAPSPHPVPVYVAALRPKMLTLAAEHADGTIINWLAADDVPRVRGVVGDDLPVVARLIVAATEDTEQARAMGRRLIAAYLTVPAYAAYQRWLGRTNALQRMWDLWAAGDRRAAAASIPDEVVDQLVVHGPNDAIRAHLERYAAHGVTVPVAYLLPIGDQAAAARALSPAAQSNPREP